jgi:hypothetical protein
MDTDMKHALKNTFFDINKLPSEKGLLIFGLSMNKILTRQNAEHCLQDIRNFSPSKISKPLVGLNFIYADFLYLYNGKPAQELKNTFMNSTIIHKNSMQKLLQKNFLEFQIQHSFNFLVWNQLYLGTKDFNSLFQKVITIYKKDKLFQKYLEEDCETYQKERTVDQVNFFLEEALMIYLLNHNKIQLPNDYIDNNQHWILFCYPGRAIKTIVYIHQLNPFKLNWGSNPYRNAYYDLEAKELIDGCKQ